MRIASVVVLVGLLAAACSSSHVPTLADALRHQPAGLVTFPSVGNVAFTIGTDTGRGCASPFTASLMGLAVTSGARLWRQPIPWSWPGDDVAGGMVLGVADQVGLVPATVWAADARSGRPRWQRFLASQGVTILGVSAGRLLIATGDDIVALDAATGAEVWRQSAGAPGGPLGVQGAPGVLFVGGSIVGVDPVNGERRFTVAGPYSFVSAVQQTAAVGGGEILVGATGRTLVGLDPATGARRWATSLPFDATFDRVDNVLTEPGVVVAVLGSGLGPDHRIAVVSPSNGTVAWMVDGVSDLDLAGDVVMIDRRRFPVTPPGDTRTVIARDAASGSELWSAPSNVPVGGFIGSMDGRAVFYVQSGSGSSLVVLNARTGVTSQGARPTELIGVPLPTAGLAPPALLQVGASTIAWTGDAIANIDLTTAVTAWQVHPAQPVLGTLAAVGNVVIADTGSPAEFCD